MSKAAVAKKPYEAPRVLVLGSVHQMTQGTMSGNMADGSLYHHLS